MLRLVWDTSALLNLKEPNGDGYSPANSLWKDLADGWIAGPYQNILPGLAYFELQSSISRMQREGRKMLRDFYILGDNEIVYPIDLSLARKANELISQPGFAQLKGADLIFACIAKLEDAWLVTLDKGFRRVANTIKLLDLNDSLERARYREALNSATQIVP